MYSFVHPRDRLFCRFLVLFLVLNVCWAQDSSTDSGSDSSSSSSFEYPVRLPCKDNNDKISSHGETYQLRKCSLCTCNNSTLSCEFETCLPPSCREPLEFENVCCKLCPYNVMVTDVQPKINRNAEITQDTENSLAVNLDVNYDFNSETTSVKGQLLWTTRMWISTYEDGSNELSGTVVEEVLTEGQQSQDLKKARSELLGISDIRYKFDLAGHTCAESKYLCAKFNKGLNPEVERDYLDFYFQAVPTEEVLTGCTEITRCRGPANVLVQNVEPVVARGTVLKEGKENALEVNVDVNYVDTPKTTDASGTQLWTMRMWMSSDENGASVLSGTQVENILTPNQQSQNLIKDPTELMGFEDISYTVDLADHSCSQARYLCARFDKGPDPQLAKKYTDLIVKGDPGEPALTGCTEIEDCEGVKVTNLEWSGEFENMQFGEPTPITIDATVSTARDSREISGSGLWQMDMFGSNTMDGSDQRKPLVSQILDGANQGKPLANAGDPIQFTNINTRFPVEEVGCGEFRYLCLEFKKGGSPNPQYTFGTTTGADSLVKCREEKCRGVYVSSVDSTLRGGGIVEGEPSNEVRFDTVVQTTDESRPIVGDNVWRLNLYGSEQSDGLGTRYNEEEQVLNAAHSGRPLRSPGQSLPFVPIQATYDMTGLDCTKVRYLCNEFSRNPESPVNFDLLPVPEDDPSVLRDCMEVPDDFCNGVLAERFDWEYTPGRPIPGQATPVEFKADLITSSKSRDLEGSGLWRMGVYGSKSPNGDPTDRFGYVSQALNTKGAATTLKGGTPMPITDQEVNFDLGSIGCNEYGYVCAEFTKADNPEPEYKFEVVTPTAVPGSNIMTSCKKQECSARAVFTDLESTIEDGIAVEGRAENIITMDVTGITGEDSTNVAGTNLWRVGTYGSATPDGLGRKIAYEQQVLNQPQMDQTLPEGENLPFDNAQVNFDMTGLQCEDVNYLCTELRKNPDAKPNYQFEAVPNERALISCNEFGTTDRCKGVTVTDMDWSYEPGLMQYGMPTPLSIDSNVLTTPESRQLDGSGLWKMNLFGSQNPDGSGTKQAERSQILDSSNQAKTLPTGGPLVFEDINTQYPIEDLGCEDYKYLCLEFEKGVYANPRYKLEIDGPGDSIIKCKSVECGDVYVSSVDSTLRGGGIVEGEPNNEVRFDTVVQTTDESRPVGGNNVWSLNLYGSEQSDGLGTRYNEQEQVFNAAHSGRPLRIPGEAMSFVPIQATYDMTGLDCTKVRYLCNEFSRNPESPVNFELLPVPEDDPSVLRDCMEVPDDFCRGVLAERFEWEYTPGRPIPGQATPVKFKADLITSSRSRDLEGTGLWRMGVYGSRSPNGDPTDRFGYVSQALNTKGAATTLKGGTPMPITDQEVNFELGSIGCYEYGYVCAEFTKADNPEPEYKFEVVTPTAVPGSNVMTSCKEQECSARAVFTDLESTIEDGFAVEGRADNIITMDVTGITDDESTIVEGTNLWRVGTYGSATPDGFGRKVAYQQQVLNQPHMDQTLPDGENLPFDDAQVNFDMTGLQCEDVNYLCTELRKNPDAKPSYKFEAVPDERALISCNEFGTTDRCKGVTVTDMDWSYEPGLMQYGMPTPLSIDSNVLTTPESRQLDGTGLWKMNLFGSRNLDGSGTKQAERSQILDSFNQAKTLPTGGPIVFEDINTQYPIEDLGCEDYKYLCLEFEKGYYADPKYKFETAGPGDSLIKCKSVDCGAVYVTNVDSTLRSADLYEGKESNIVQFDTAVTTTDESVPVFGLNMWRLNLYGSERPNGQGPRYNPQEQVLSDYHSSRELAIPGDVLDFRPIDTEYDMTGVNCKKLKYLCTEFSRNPSSSREFELIPQPNEGVLKDCMEVPEEMCKGVIIEDMDWTMNEVTGKVTPGVPTPIRLDIDVEPRPTAGSASGNNLWRVGIYGATRPDGKGKQIGLRRQILTRGQSSRDLTASDPLEFTGIDTQFDLSQIGCETEFQYLCVEFTKGIRAQPDFKFQTADGGNVIVKCKDEECRKGVKIRGLNVGYNNLTTLKENTPNNRVLYDLTALTTPDSGGVVGDDLWELSLFGSNNINGVGPRLNEEREPFNNYQRGKDVEPGENIRYQFVDTTFDMRGLTCSEVPFLCTELRKGSRPDPDFQLIAVPDRRSLRKCFRTKCDGVTIDSTTLDGNDFTIGDTTNEIEFDVSFTSNPSSGDASGNNLWNLETYVANNPDGLGPRRTLEKQTLTPNMASRDLKSGTRVTFNRLAARINKDDVPCSDGGGYVCVEIQKAARSSFDFTLNGAREDSLRRCRKLTCAKARVVEGSPGERGERGELAPEPNWDLFPGAPGNAGPPGYKGPRGYPGLAGARGVKGPSGNSGPGGYSGVPGTPGPPGPPGEAITAPAISGSKKSMGTGFGNSYGSGPAQVVQGPPGPPGPPGPDGERGATGRVGIAGNSGPVGNRGSSGPAGPRGADGDDGNDGEDGSPGSLGTAGPVGTQGPTGSPGNPGRQGHKGWRGRRGRKGFSGDTGDAGDVGATGAQGPSGLQGARGERGLQGARGDRGNRGAPGARGQGGSNGDIGNVGPMGAVGTLGPMGFAGAKGDAGATGDIGQPGLQGEVGEGGSDGASGAAGAAGASGKNGAAGEIGDVGGVGPTGSLGAMGARGPSGTRGAPGVGGELGSVGYPGQPGARGSAGLRGPRGGAGPVGQPGSDGSDGATGPGGPNGGAGPQGPSGARGGVGGPGPPGPAGAQGLQGNSGEPGASGPPGEKGDSGQSGPIGNAGAPGATGEPGNSGRDGNTGKPGPPGLAGNDGRRGPPGPSGTRGGRGLPGASGAPGAPGDEGRTGNPGPAGAGGQRGTEGDIGAPGPVGPAGATGARGDAGPQGPAGPVGPNGGVGMPGPRGAKGRRGVPGPIGNAGQVGPEGLQGERGLTGSMGLVGAAGEGGPSGPDGRDGRNGEPGAKGALGDVGRIGIPGLPGMPGDRGGVGAIGNDGAPGAKGPSGDRGESGKSGLRGNPGPPGPGGSPGLEGESGDVGRSGRTGPLGPEGSTGERGRQGRPGARGIPGGPGPQGPVGARGEKGSKGAVGDQGPQGGVGSDGRAGAPGALGAKGARGEPGGQGAVGPGGSPGSIGMPGPTGAPGARGIVGPTGASGKPGPAGRRGGAGQQGAQGIRGVPGTQGQSGSRGNDGRSGSAGPAGLAGPAGPLGILGELGGMGAMGAPGPTGPAGRPGADGSSGKRGAPGSNGPLGPAGATGAKGLRGPTGDEGRDGNGGRQGPQGATGPDGGKGPQGALGSPGVAGMPGRQGPAGGPGERGSRGTAGPAGSRGSTGSDGDVGPAGPAGPAGARGESGAPGIMGHKGWGGPPGRPGLAGPKGPPGGRGGAGKLGSPGLTGIEGAQGRNGKDGVQGPRGMDGPGGQRGPSGRVGPSGPPGPPGAAGAPGAMSYSQGGYAYSGPSGVGGNKGANPYEGYYGDDAEIEEDDYEARIKQLRVRIMKLMLPNGEPEYPARSCKDIFKCYPYFPSGYYTLDPSGGSDYDKFVAYCDKKTNATCIYPEQTKILKATYYLGETSEPVDFSAMMNGFMVWQTQKNGALWFEYEFKINYSVKPVQLTLLRLMYLEATQNITYHCRNSHAVSDHRGRVDKAVTLIGPDDVRMNIADTHKDLQYNVEGQDGCMEHKDTWGQTTVSYTSKKTERLPLVDFAVRDIGRSKQQFGVDIGPVCFF